MDLDHLNPSQRAAVTAADGYHLVVAGAGTGKTRTLVHRVAWLVDQGVPADQIALLTFSRRAAREMLDRAAALVGAEARRVRGGTFHSFAATLLRQHGARLGYPPAFTVLDTDDAEALVGLARDSLGIPRTERRLPRKDTLFKMISSAANTSRTVRAVVEQDYPKYAPEIGDIERVAAAYDARKREQGVMDFDDLLHRLVDLLQEHPDVRRQVSSRLRYVLVDEFQDTNRVQAQIAVLLAVENGNLMVVGDEAQSIYGFRGAAVENILDFPQLDPNCSVTLLEDNYRSVQPVLDLANGVLAGASRGYDKRLRANIPGGRKPIFAEVPTEEDQAEWVVREILSLREEGEDLRDIAVLVRSAYQANLLEVNLGRANVPFRKFGGITFTQLAHVKDVLALLRLVANPRDELAWARVLPWLEGLGGTSAARVIEGILATEPPRLDPEDWSKKKFYGGLITLARLLEDAEPLRERPAALLDHLLKWYRTKLEDLYEDARVRRRDLDALETLAELARDLAELIAELALDPVEGTREAEAEDEWITVSTIHSAKGLEWGTVFVLQLVNGHFPTGYAMETDDGLEEERRLLYVAVTRAKRNLYLMQPSFIRPRYGAPLAPGCELLDAVPGFEELVAWPELSPRPEPEPPAPAGPDMAAAKQRMDAFLTFFAKKR